MSILFAQILNMSLTASVVILCVMAARLLLKRSPKIFSYALWSVVLFRLLCPVSLPAPVSVLEVTKPQTAEIGGISYVAYTPVENVLIESGDAASHVQEEPISIKELQENQTDKTPSVMDIASVIWVAGIAVMVLYSVVTYIRLYRKLVGAVQWRGNAYLADHVASPFVLGTLFPKIYLPSDTPMKERRYILAHERHHIRRGDHIIKLAAYAALCIHWFNPLVWAAFILAGKDMEMSCDEAVIKKLGEHIRADYSASLLRLATHRHLIAGTPLAFGEGDTKGRIRNMAKWKKPKVWVSILCVVLCIIIVVVCAVNPEPEGETAAETAEEEKPVEIVMMNGSTTAGFGELYFTLPAGYTMEAVAADAGDYEYMMQISDGTNMIGGVVYYDAPDLEFVSLEDTKDMTLWNQDEWIAAMGLPDAMDETLGYMGGGSLYADYEIEYFTDLPEPVENPVQRQHYLYMWEDSVYDFWFDETVVGYQTIETIMKTAAVGQHGPLIVEAAPTETEALEKCRAVLEAVQSGSSHIYLEQRYGQNAGTGDYTQEYLCYDDSWLNTITVQIAGITEKHANLYANGRHFSNMGKWSEEEILWTEMKTEANALRPWLTSFRWSEDNVTYVDTLTSDGDTVVMLRIDEPYPGYEDVTECYWVDFRFDPSGSFLKMELEVDYIRDDEIQSLDITESIVTLDAAAVAAEIDAEYRRATGEELPTAAGMVSTKEEGIAKCRAVLDLVQSSEGYQIRTDSAFEGENILNDSTVEWYSRHGEDWLSIVELPGVRGIVDGEPVDYERQGYLYKNGTYYSNETDGELDAGNAIRWSQSRELEGNEPWLATFDWAAQIVECPGVYPEAGGECVNLIVIDPHYNGEKRLVTYSALFHFDEEGNFRNVVLSAALYDASIGEYSVESTESILSLDADTAAAEIEKEYKRAMS